MAPAAMKTENAQPHPSFVDVLSNPKRHRARTACAVVFNAGEEGALFSPADEPRTSRAVRALCKEGILRKLPVRRGLLLVTKGPLWDAALAKATFDPEWTFNRATGEIERVADG